MQSMNEQKTVFLLYNLFSSQLLVSFSLSPSCEPGARYCVSIASFCKRAIMSTMDINMKDTHA